MAVEFEAGICEGTELDMEEGLCGLPIVWLAIGEVVEVWSSPVISLSSSDSPEEMTEVGRRQKTSMANH